MFFSRTGRSLLPALQAALYPVDLRSPAQAARHGAVACGLRSPESASTTQMTLFLLRTPLVAPGRGEECRRRTAQEATLWNMETVLANLATKSIFVCGKCLHP